MNIPPDEMYPGGWMSEDGRTIVPAVLPLKDVIAAQYQPPVPISLQVKGKYSFADYRQNFDTPRSYECASCDDLTGNMFIQVSQNLTSMMPVCQECFEMGIPIQLAMTVDQYRDYALTTLNGKVPEKFTDEQARLLYAALIIAQATGKLTERAKKHCFHGKPLEGGEDVNTLIGEVIAAARLAGEVASAEDFVIRNRLVANFRKTFDDNEMRQINMALGLIGEGVEAATELAAPMFLNQIDQPELRRRAVKELGDVMWYLTCAVKLIGTNMGKVMWANRLKLWQRHKGKFNPAYHQSKHQSNHAA